MPLDSAFLLKVKEHVTSKLKSLGAFIDEELPDYIMVMVANKKSESSMAKDLQLFLGEHTVEFTKWLHSTLEDIKHSDRAKAKSKEKDHSHGLSKVKSGRNKSNKDQLVIQSNSCLLEDAQSGSRSRSRSPLDSGKSDQNVGRSREPHGEELFHIHADDDEFTGETISSSDVVQEKRKVMNTAILSGKYQADQDDVQVDSTQGAIRSVVKVKQAPVKHRAKVDRDSGKSLQPVGRLLQQAVNETRANVQSAEPNRSRGITGRTAVGQPVNCTDVSSSGSAVDGTKFYVTLPGTERRHPRDPINTADSSMGPHWPSEDAYHSDSRAVSNVKSRLGTRRILPYSRPVKLSAKERLGPVVHLSSHGDSGMNDSLYDTLDDQDDMVEIVEGDSEDTEYIDEDTEVDFPSQSTVERSALSSRIGAGRLVDKFNQKQLVVRLDDAEDDDDVVQVDNAKRMSASSNVTAVSNGSDDQVNIPSSLERCKFWPNCRNGDKCQYIHPTEPCPTFPRCRLGATCTYIHPPCRYGAACTRSDCAFAHSTKRGLQPQPVIPVSPSVNASQVVCRFQSRCTNAFCPFYHPFAPVLPRIPVFRPHIITDRPVSISPIPCRNGPTCPNRPKCPFNHSDTLKRSQLKWVAPSKQLTVTAATNLSATSVKETSQSMHSNVLAAET
ncbi:Zinc finger CCCH domain-containing protein 14 [Paragonimus heterotremus]|uniref:Zinc finger CCCH domain-containing protein 14 n=1 Tax=Paragonimus heterotremus TaxID=100268 RepID=A0A8J4WKR6_9TREM|nr:Zinc finger CCCH domain-containing protein 14 [Paragonimus heterotremus]